MNISHITIATSSLEESMKFYQEVLDFDLERKLTTEEGIKIAFLADQQQSKIELVEMEQRPPARESNVSTGLIDDVSIGFIVDDIDKTEAHLKQHQVQITMGPRELSGGVKLLQAKDPSGVQLNFVEYKVT